MMRRKPSRALSVTSMVAAPRRPFVKVSLPRRTPREASSSTRGACPATFSATTTRIALAPMSRTATGRSTSGWGGGRSVRGSERRFRAAIGLAPGRPEPRGAHDLGGPGRAHADVDLERLREELRPALDAPRLELAVALRLRADPEDARPLRGHEAPHHLAVAAVEGVGHPEEAGEDAHRPLLLLPERPVAFVLPTGVPAAVVARDVRDRLDLPGVEPAQPPVLDQVV